MLELIFRGFFEWIYSLIVEMWGFIAGGLLDIMGLDFAYLQSHIPIMDDMAQVLLAAGWALLLGNLVFQALKSMAAGLGFEGEDPRLLFARTFVFAFLLLASPQICRIGLDLTSNIMELLSIPDATNVSLLDESIFGTLTASWVMAIICSVIVMFKVLKLVIEIAERYVILAMLTLTAPLAFAMGGSKNTAGIFTGWCRMFGSMCLLMVTNLVCFKMLFSVVSTVPSGFDVIPWMVLIFAIVKVAHKSDEIITRIGLNPALTGGGGRTLLGTVVNTAVRTVTSQATKSVMGRLGFGSGASASGTRSGGGFGGFQLGSRFSADGGGRFGGTRSGGRSSGGQTSGNGVQGGGRGGGRSSSSQTSGNGSQNFGGTRGGGRYTYQSTAQQADTRQENTAQTSAHAGNTGTASSNTPRGGGRPQQGRRSSVPPGGQRPRSYVPPSGGGQTAPKQGGTSPSQQGGGSRPGSMGTTPKSGVSRPGGAGTVPTSTRPRQPNSPQSGAAGTGAARSTHSATQTAGGSTVNNTSRTSAQTTVTAEGGRPGGSTAKAPSGSPRAPRPGGPSVPKSGDRPGGTSQPGSAGRPSRSTQRPDGSPSRPSKNTASTSAAPPAGATAPNPAPQERSHSSGRSPGGGASSRPARQEGRRSPASASSPVKGGAPSIRPGGAGTAPTGKQAAGQSHTAKARTARAKPAHRPPPNRRGGNGRG